MGPFQVIARATRASLCGWRLEVGVGEATGQCGQKGPSAEVALELPIKSPKICLYYPQMLGHSGGPTSLAALLTEFISQSPCLGFLFPFTQP